MSSNASNIIQETQDWLIKAVIGLNLCPFAKAVHVKEQIKYVVSEATTIEQLLENLAQELEFLAEVSREKTDTTLLIHPKVLGDFLDYNDFLELADQLLEDLDLEANLGEVLVIFRYGNYRLDEWEDDCKKVYDFIINKLHDYNGGWDSKPTTSDLLSLLTKNNVSKDSIELFLEYFMMNLGRMLDNMGYPTDQFELTIKLKDNG